MRRAVLALSFFIAACPSSGSKPEASAPAPAKEEASAPAPASEPAERWAGSLLLPDDQRLDLMLSLTRGETPAARLTIPAQKLTDAALRDVSVDGRRLRFTLGPPNPEPRWARFDVTVSEDGLLADGVMLQAGGAYRATFQRIPLDGASRAGFEGALPALPGDAWSGTIAVGEGQSLAFTARLLEGRPPSGTIDIPAQGLFAGALHDVSVSDSGMAFTFRPPGGAKAQWAVFLLQRIGDVATGTMTQSGRTLAVSAKRGEAVQAQRPQTPAPPFPYTTREVRVEDVAPGVVLAGTLAVPEGPGPHPAALLLSGSGPQDRDETLYGHKPFLVLADHLARSGIAVLRLDDRGVGGSTGDLGRATSADLAADARAALAFLARQPEVRADGVGLIGHSEGGLLTAMIAGAEGSSGVSWVVLLATPGVSGREIILHQTSAMVATDGAPAEDVEAARKAAERALDQLAAGASRKELRAAIRAMVDAQRKLGAPIGPELVDATVEAAVEQMRSPWYRYFVGYDPAPDLQKIRVPVLALGGSLDRQVPAEASLTAIEAALVKGGNKDVTTAVLPGLNHLLQTAVAGTVQEYAQIEETFDPAALKRISEWVVKRAGR